MIQKSLLLPERKRRLPAHWSWVDHRLVREHYFPRCGHQAWSLYLFLVCVGDEQGLSYYSGATLCQQLQLDLEELKHCRHELIEAGLLAYRRPLYQVLDLDKGNTGPRQGEALPAGELLRRILEKGGQR